MIQLPRIHVETVGIALRTSTRGESSAVQGNRGKGPSLIIKISGSLYIVFEKKG